MSARPRIALTREGRYYLFVLAFIVGGAVLREVNLLVVLAALMTGPILFSWRAVVMTLRRLTVRRRVPARATAGETITVSVGIENHRRTLPSWALVATDRVQDAAEADAGPQGAADATRDEASEAPCEAPAFFAVVPPGEERTSTYRLTLPRRGRYRFGPLVVSTAFPFDFVRGEVRGEETSEILVVPRTGRLTRAWRSRVESRRLGQQRARRRRGHAEGDYYGLREWRPGDSRRWIHWRTSAKLGTASVLQFEELRHHDLALVIDLWRPEAPRTEDAAYVEFAASFAATAATEWCRQGGSELAAAVAGAEVGCWSGAASRMLAQAILDHLATARATPRGGLLAALRALEPAVRRGARLLVISTRTFEAARDAALDEPELAERLGAIDDWLDVRAPEVREMLQFDGPGASR